MWVVVKITRRKRLKLSTPKDVRQALARIANMVLNDEITKDQANTIIYASNAILSAIRTDEQEKKIDQLERKLEESERSRLN